MKQIKHNVEFYSKFYSMKSIYFINAKMNFLKQILKDVNNESLNSNFNHYVIKQNKVLMLGM